MKENKLYWPLSKLRENPNNPRVCSPDELDLLEESMREDSLFYPLLIKTDGVVLGGNHRLKVLRRISRVEPLNPIVFPSGKPEAWVEVRDPQSRAEELRLIAKANATYARWHEDRLKNEIEAAGKAFNRQMNRFQLGPIVTAKELMKEEQPPIPEDESQETCPECNQKIRNKKEKKGDREL